MQDVCDRAKAARFNLKSFPKNGKTGGFDG